jgi:hypothetical protein
MLPVYLARLQARAPELTAASLRVLRLPRDCAGAGLWLANLRNCIVSIETPLVALRINGLVNSVVLSGPIAGSAHIEHVSDALVAVACRQIRIHHATNVDFALDTRSRPIIEHSNTIRFSPYVLAYPGLCAHCDDTAASPALCRADGVPDPEHASLPRGPPPAPDSTTTSAFRADAALIEPAASPAAPACLAWCVASLAAGLHTDDEAFWGPEAEERGAAWSQVDDFNWLRTQQSPNWGICARGDRLKRLLTVAVVPTEEQ